MGCFLIVLGLLFSFNGLAEEQANQIVFVGNSENRAANLDSHNGALLSKLLIIDSDIELDLKEEQPLLRRFELRWQTQDGYVTLWLGASGRVTLDDISSVRFYNPPERGLSWLRALRSRLGLSKQDRSEEKYVLIEFSGTQKTFFEVENPASRDLVPKGVIVDLSSKQLIFVNDYFRRRGFWRGGLRVTPTHFSVMCSERLRSNNGK